MIPLMCADKSPQELDSFAALYKEATQFDQPWRMVFAGALSGTPGSPPAEKAVDIAFEVMVEDLKQGQLDRYIPFDREGLPVQIG